MNYDSGAAVTALPVAVAGNLLLEKRGEFRVASGAVVPNFGKIKMKSTDESGVARSIRGHITEVAKTAAECCGGLEEMGLPSLRGRRNPFGTKLSYCLGDPSNFEKSRSLESSWQEHQTSPRRQLVHCVRASWRCHAGACTS